MVLLDQLMDRECLESIHTKYWIGNKPNLYTRLEQWLPPL
jgi:hypothetical protein